MKKSHPKCWFPRNLHPRRARFPSPPCDRQHGGRLAGCGVGCDSRRGDPASARILAVLLTPAPAWVSTLVDAHTFNHKTRAKPVSYLLLPFASVRGGAVHPTVLLLYLRVCGCGWMDRQRGDWWSVLPLELIAGQLGAEAWRGKVEGEQWDTSNSTHKMKLVYYQLMWRTVVCLLSNKN